jgi:hypothetical protein
MVGRIDRIHADIAQIEAVSPSRRRAICQRTVPVASPAAQANPVDMP